MDIRKFMKRKSISDRRSVENYSDKWFQKWFCSTSKYYWENRKRIY